MWAANKGNIDIAEKILAVPRMEEFVPREMWHKLLKIAQHKDNIPLAKLLFQVRIVQTSVESAAASKAGRGLHRLDKKTQLDDGELLLQPMFEAAKKGQQALIELYLSHVSVNLHDGDGLSALHHAASCGQYDLAKFLLEDHGANPDIRSRHVIRPIELAVREGHLRVVELLLLNGVDPRSDGSDLSVPFLMAARLGDESMVKLFLQHHRIDPRARNGSGVSPMESAIFGDKAEIVRVLLDDGRVDPNEQNHESKTPLHLAVECCKDEIVCLLLDDDRVDPNSRDNHGMTPLLVASSSFSPQNKQILDILLEEPRVDASARDDDGCNACTLAAKYGILHTIEALLLNRKIDPNQGDDNGQTPAMYAAAGYQREGEITPVYLAKENHLLLVALIADERVDLNRTDRNGETAMHWAVKNCRRENVKLLLESGRVDVNQEGVPACRPLIEACILKDSEMTKLLLDSGNVDMSKTNSRGETPLMFAIWRARGGNNDLERTIWMVLDREKHGSLELRYGNGLTMLERAVEMCAKTIVSMLLHTGKVVVTPRAMELCRHADIRELLTDYDGKPSAWWKWRELWKFMGIWE